MPQDWMKDPLLAGIDPAKMALLNSFVSQGTGKSQNEIVSLMMAAANSSRSRGLQFTPDEMERVIQVLKAGKSPQEIAKMDKMLSLMRMMQR